MPQNQSSTPKIRCISCAKIIAEGTMTAGEISIICKCGVRNTIAAKAEKKPEGQIPERTTVVSIVRGYAM